MGDGISIDKDNRVFVEDLYYKDDKITYSDTDGCYILTLPVMTDGYRKDISYYNVCYYTRSSESLGIKIQA